MGLTQNLGLLSTAIKATSTLNVGIGTSSPNLSAGATGSTIVTISATASGRNGLLELNGTRTTENDIVGYVRFFNNAAATPLADIRAIRGSSNTAGSLAFDTSGTERMRITSVGYTGINTSSPESILHISGGAYASSRLTIQRTSGAVGKYSIGVQTDNNTFGIVDEAQGGLTRVLINGSGNVLIGTTTDSGQKMTVNGNITVSLAGSAHLFLDTTPFGGAYAYNMQIKNNAGNGNFYIQRTSDGTGVYIPFGGTSWGGVSDERLKTDLVEIQNAAYKVNQLRAVTGRFKTDEIGKSRSFLIAQDLKTVLPEAVNEDSESGYLGITYTDVIPLLVAAIKELKAENDTLKTRIENLENK